MTVLRMQLDLPEGSDPGLQIEGTGVVVRCQPIAPHVEHFEVAVFLNDMRDSHRVALERFVSARE